jgi:hypothetical protein
VDLVKVNTRQLVLKLFIWLFAEIVLSFLGLDDLADYSEYLQEQNTIAFLGSQC